MEDKERLRKEADHSRLAGSRFTKQGNLHRRLVWGSHSPARILIFFIEVLTGFSSDGLSNTLLSQGYEKDLKQLYHTENIGGCDKCVLMSYNLKLVL